MPKPTADDIRAYIDRALEAWKKEPPTDPYEEGHEAAFRELKEYADTDCCEKRIHTDRQNKAISPGEG
jgi:hypothetical protein